MEIKTVLLIDADHLDVGYHGLVSDVVNRYWDEFWPRAMRVRRAQMTAARSCFRACIHTRGDYPPSSCMRGTPLPKAQQ